MPIGQIVKTALRCCGLEVQRYRPASARRIALLREYGIGTVFDVGANAGQYGTELRVSGFDGDIVSFEPLDTAFGELLNASAGDDRWQCHKTAVSDHNGAGIIHVAGNSASSSLLVMADAHNDAAPHARLVGSQDVTLSRLDDVDGIRDLPRPWMLKMDVQGHESAALDGAENLLEHVNLVEAELSVRELYDGAPLMTAMLVRMEERGFELVALEPGFYDPRDGTYLQFDGLFRRRT